MPFYDDFMGDPFGLDPYNVPDLDALMRQRMAQRPGSHSVPIPLLAPEEEKSLLGRIGESALGGLGYVGGVLNKLFGGRAVKGALGGNARELLSIIPGSDFFSITNPHDEVTGKQLLQKAGIIDDEDSWLNTGLGIGADIALDPATYLSFGGSALTKAGKVAEKMGAFTGKGMTLRQRLGGWKGLGDIPEHVLENAKAMNVAPESMLGSLGGIAGLRLPFTDIGTPLLTGSAGTGVLDAAGWLAEKAGKTPFIGHQAKKLYSGVIDPASRQLAALFKPEYQGMTDPIDRQVASANWWKTEREVAKRKEKYFELARKQKEFGFVGPANEAALVDAMEGLKPIETLPTEMQDVVRQLKALKEETFLGSRARGVVAERLDDPFVPEHGARHAADVVYGGGEKARFGRKSSFNAYSDELSARKAELTGLPGGRNALNELSLDPELRNALSDVGGAEYIRKKLGISGEEGVMREQFATKTAELKALRDKVDELAALGKDPKEIQASLVGHSPYNPKDIAEAIKPVITPKESDLLGLLPELLAGKRPDSWSKYVDESLKEIEQGWMSKTLGTSRFMRGLPAEHIERGIPIYGNPLVQDEMMSNIARLKANLKAESALELIKRTALPMGQSSEGAIPLTKALELAGLRGEAEYAMPKLLEMFPGVKPHELESLMIPAAQAKDLMRSQWAWQAPEALRGPIDLLDRFKSYMERMWTSIWPAFHVRNKLSGEFSNLNQRMFGGLSGGQLVSKGLVPGAAEIPWMKARGIATDAEASRILGEQMAAWNLTGGVFGTPLRNELSPQAAFEAMLPGQVPLGMKDVIKPLREGTAGEWASVLQPETQPWMRAGSLAGRKVEDTNAASAYVAAMMKGYAPEAAAAVASKAQYVPRTMTPFESQVMRRLVPFYSWQRQNLPRVAESMLTEPGGLYSMYAKAAHGLRRDDQGFVPEYLGGGLALPVGSEKAGTQRYLTSLGLAPESAFDFLKVGPKGPQETLMAMLGNLNPFIKGPLEYATGKQFFSGRDIPTLHSTTGLPLVDQTIMNSPAARFLTTYRQMTDPRKWEGGPLAGLGTLGTNLLTGGKFSDVDVEKARERYGSEYIREALKGEPGIRLHESLSVNPEEMSMLSQREIALMQLYRSIEARQRERAKLAREGAVAR